MSVKELEEKVQNYFDREWDNHWTENLHSMKRWREQKDGLMDEMKKDYQALTKQEQSIFDRKLMIMLEVAEMKK